MDAVTTFMVAGANLSNATPTGTRADSRTESWRPTNTPECEARHGKVNA
jgi:hypothetical protein